MIDKIINYFKTHFGRPSEIVNVCNCTCQEVPNCKKEPSIEQDIADAKKVKDRISHVKKQPRVVKTEVIVTKSPKSPRKKK